MTASPLITSFSVSEKEKEGKRKTAQGTAPRSEIHYVAAGRGGDIMNSMRLRPLRTPGERAIRGRQTTEMLCTAEKVSVFGAKRVCSRAARHDSNFGFPLRAAKQGRGNESVSGGDREPRLPEPQRDSSARRR